MDSSAVHKVGSRLLVSLIDWYAANDPSRIWASVPIDEHDLAKGFQDITYESFANTINHAVAWFNEYLPSPVEPFETAAYSGPKDWRYAVIAVAFAKLERKLLLPSPFATTKAQAHLARISNCRTFLHAASSKQIAEDVLSELGNSDVHALEVPEISAWSRKEPACPIPFTKTWDEARYDPWLILHTSGTTGLPKLITYTHQMMTSIEASETMDDAHVDNWNRHFENRRWYTPLPTLHVVGMLVSLQLTVSLGSIVVIGPKAQTTPVIARDVLRYGKVQGAMVPPSLIDSLCDDQAGLETLRNLEYLYFAGAPISAPTAQKLLGHVTLKPGIGSTEAGPYHLQHMGDTDWEYYCFRPSNGLEFWPTAGDLCEPVFVKKPEYERFQQVFQVYPDLEVFHTKDLFVEHKTKPGLWKYIGRTDDLIVFSHGEDLYAADIEAELNAHPDVVAVLVGGQGRPKPFLLVEWKDNKVNEKAKLDQLWPSVEQANKGLSDLVKLSRELILFTDPEKKLVRTVKDTVSRKESEKLYAEEIDRLYKN